MCSSKRVRIEEIRLSASRYELRLAIARLRHKANVLAGVITQTGLEHSTQRSVRRQAAKSPQALHPEGLRRRVEQFQPNEGAADAGAVLLVRGAIGHGGRRQVDPRQLGIRHNRFAQVGAH